MTEEQEVAETLGFASVEAMYEHQRWLEDQQEMGDRIRERVRQSGQIIDIRDLQSTRREG